MGNRFCLGQAQARNIDRGDFKLASSRVCVGVRGGGGGGRDSHFLSQKRVDFKKTN